MRFGFVTCVELGRSCIEEILKIGGRLDLLLTLKDNKSVNKAGRVYLDDLADEHQIPLVKVDHINNPEAIDAIREAKLDWLFIIGWSQVASQEVLDSTSKGVLGMHPTLLPQGRGRAAIPWAIIKNLKTTGVTLFVLDEGVDTGPIVDQLAINVSENETATSLYSKVGEAHSTLIRNAWPTLVSGNYKLVPQDHSIATEWPERRPEDGRITPDMTVDAVDRLVRAVAKPYPGAYWDLHDRRYRVWSGTTTKPVGNTLELHVKHGVYYATEYDIETCS